MACIEAHGLRKTFGTTVAHGNLTLSLIDGLRIELLRSTGFKLGVNYGWNKVRYTAPVPAGAGPSTSSIARTGSGRARTASARAPTTWRAISEEEA